MVELINMIEKLKRKIGRRVQDKNLRELLKGTSSTFVIRVLGFVIGYIFVIIISRFYGPKIVGAFTLCSTVLIIFSVVGKFQISFL